MNYPAEKKQILNGTTTPSLTPPSDPNRLLRLPEVLLLIPVCRSTWLGWVAARFAPAPIRLGRTTAWRYIDLLNFINDNEGVGHEE